MAVTPKSTRLNRGLRAHPPGRLAAAGQRSHAAADIVQVSGNPRGARRPACDTCGKSASVQLLAGYRDGRPVRRQLCLACAGTAPELLRPLIPSRHLRLDAALVLAGALVCVLGLVRDLLPTSVGGFGWQQMLGVSVGALVLVLGLITRVDFLAAGGVVVLGIAGAADLLLSSSSSGIGWKQELLIVFGLVIVLAGLRLGRIRRRARSLAGPRGTPAQQSAVPIAGPELAAT